MYRENQVYRQNRQRAISNGPSSRKLSDEGANSDNFVKKYYPFYIRAIFNLHVICVRSDSSNYTNRDGYCHEMRTRSFACITAFRFIETLLSTSLPSETDSFCFDNIFPICPDENAVIPFPTTLPV